MGSSRQYLVFDAGSEFADVASWLIRDAEGELWRIAEGVKVTAVDWAKTNAEWAAKAKKDSEETEKAKKDAEDEKAKQAQESIPSMENSGCRDAAGAPPDPQAGHQGDVSLDADAPEAQEMSSGGGYPQVADLSHLKVKHTFYCVSIQEKDQVRLRRSLSAPVGDATKAMKDGDAAKAKKDAEEAERATSEAEEKEKAKQAEEERKATAASLEDVPSFETCGCRDATGAPPDPQAGLPEDVKAQKTSNCGVYPQVADLSPLKVKNTFYSVSMEEHDQVAQRRSSSVSPCPLERRRHRFEGSCHYLLLSDPAQ